MVKAPPPGPGDSGFKSQAGLNRKKCRQKALHRRSTDWKVQCCDFELRKSTEWKVQCCELRKSTDWKVQRCDLEG
eukprot:4666779-Amphidinium_carterae.1